MANDFTEDDIKYTLPAKDFYRIIAILQERIEVLNLRVDQMEHQNKEDYNRLHELAIIAFNG